MRGFVCGKVRAKAAATEEVGEVVKVGGGDGDVGGSRLPSPYLFASGSAAPMAAAAAAAVAAAALPRATLRMRAMGAGLRTRVAWISAGSGWRGGSGVVGWCR